MLLLVGLGNPGAKYAKHRHNVGFMALEAIVRRHSFGPGRTRFRSIVHDGRLDGEKTLALKPQTFMNLSGEAVGEAMRFFKLSPADIVVFHDELDLAPGKIRVKTGGGHAGHNGLRSITQHIGPDFRRVRIGIGHPGDKALVHYYVLSDFAKADRDWLITLLDAMAAAAGHLAHGEDEKFMTKVALLTRPAKEKT
jgi:PTH1 family peptidyl-tRNA hydrolase